MCSDCQHRSVFWFIQIDFRKSEQQNNLHEMCQERQKRMDGWISLFGAQCITQQCHYTVWPLWNLAPKPGALPGGLDAYVVTTATNVGQIKIKVPTSWSKKQVLKSVLKFPNGLHMKVCWPTNRCHCHITHRWSTPFWMSNDSFNSRGHWALCCYHLVHNQLHKTTVISNSTRQHAAHSRRFLKGNGCILGDLEWFLPQLFKRRAPKHTSKYTSANLNDGYLVCRGGRSTWDWAGLWCWWDCSYPDSSSVNWRLSDSNSRNEHGDKHLAFSLLCEVLFCRYVRF